jgi:methionyl-tRNA formyltransferase
MRIAFAGTPAFAATVLAKLLTAQHEVVLVLTQPDRPSGRGLRPAFSAVKDFAVKQRLDVRQPITLKDPETLDFLTESRPDAIVTAAYGLILPAPVLEIAPHGAFNVHASLLPRWRGAAPIQRALLAGDRETGITIIRMEAGLDTGPILAQRSLAITDRDDSQSLHDRLAPMGGDLMASVLDMLAAGNASEKPQPGEGATYARKIQDDEAVIDWSQPAVQIERAVRAFRPAPGAQTGLRGQRCKIWHARTAPGSGEPGTVIATVTDGIRVACGEGALDITELQRAGGRRLRAVEFLRGFAVAPGERLAIAG